MALGFKLLQALLLIPSTDKIVPTVHRQIAQHHSLIENITQAVDPSTACFSNIIASLVSLKNSQLGKKAVVVALHYAAPDKATQNAAEEAWELWREADAEVSR